ncbi:MAG TPA: sn-glycerol-1-phosphate dehydrogenase [Clostridiaceae bacterium]|nr:sn-glycerol-1-phosphate dehydrogenase [Clostridiaceae bacterium]
MAIDNLTDNINELLNIKKECTCGKTHSCDIKNVIVENGALNKLYKLVEDYNNILLVADQNTNNACGKEVRELIGKKIADVLVFESKGYLVPDEKAIDLFKSKVKETTDLIIGVGSGVINDLCKYVSFINNLPYFIVVTAPSMDGYASTGAAMIINNMKVTYNAHVPAAIIADVDIIRNAPIDMLKAGYGDILGKFSCLNDWKLSHIVNNEYFCEYVYNLIYHAVKRTEKLGSKLLQRDSDAVKTLMEALIIVGIAMSYVGNSRPASGSEHHLSHFFEVIGIMNNEPYFLHGIDVAYSTLVTQNLREKILETDISNRTFKFDEAEWEKNIRNIYSKAADGVINLQRKLGWYEQDKIHVYKEHWDKIKEVLKEAPSSDEIMKLLNSVCLPIEDFENMYGKEKIDNAIWFAKDLKDRYSVLWLYYHCFR